jgi:membrane protease YdiL (CAAX protease family)
VEAPLIGPRILGLSTATIILVEAGMALFVFPLVRSPLLALCLTRGIQTAAVFTVLWGCGREPSAVGLGPGQLSSGIFRGLIWSFLFGVTALIGMAVLHMAGMEPISLIRASLPEETGAIALYFIAGSLVAPVAEEVFFRGIVFGFLRRWGMWAAVAGTTLLFVVLHLDRNGLPITQLVGGIVFCIAYEREKMLMTPITIHALGNTALFTLSLWAS